MFTLIIYFLKKNYTFQNVKKNGESVALFDIFRNLFKVWFNSRQPSYICFYI